MDLISKSTNEGALTGDGEGLGSGVNGSDRRMFGLFSVGAVQPVTGPALGEHIVFSFQ